MTFWKAQKSDFIYLDIKKNTTTTDETDAFVSQCQSSHIFVKNPKSLGNQSDDKI